MTDTNYEAAAIRETIDRLDTQITALGSQPFSGTQPTEAREWRSVKRSLEAEREIVNDLWSLARELKTDAVLIANI